MLNRGLIVRSTKSLAINEIKTFRISCRKDGCRGVIEMAAHRMDRSGQSLDCPQCREPIRDGRSSSSDAYSNFSRALVDLQSKVGDSLLLEIVVENEG